MYKDRLNRILSAIEKLDADGMLITNAKNIYYATGFYGMSEIEREAMVLILNEEVNLIIPRMYKEKYSNLQVELSSEINLVILKDGKGFIETINDYLTEGHVVLVEEYDLRFSEYENIYETLNAEIISSEKLLLKLRNIKDSGELEIISNAVDITDSVMFETVEYLKNSNYENISELEIVDFMRKVYRKQGGEKFGFDPIVASGCGSSEPHYLPTNKKLIKNTPLLIDIGISYKGYSGDLTRTFWLGDEVDEDFKKMYNLVLECNKLCVEECRAGVEVINLHNIAVDFFKKSSLDDKFIHSIGHTIGLDVHEQIVSNEGNKKFLQENTTFTIEPGLYFQGEFGIRIEDYVVVEKGSCRILNSDTFKGLVLI